MPLDLSKASSKHIKMPKYLMKEQQKKLRYILVGTKLNF